MYLYWVKHEGRYDYQLRVARAFSFYQNNSFDLSVWLEDFLILSVLFTLYWLPSLVQYVVVFGLWPTQRNWCLWLYKASNSYICSHAWWPYENSAKNKHMSSWLLEWMMYDLSMSLKIRYTFQFDCRFKDDELVLDSIGLHREDRNWFSKNMLGIERHYWN